MQCRNLITRESTGTIVPMRIIKESRLKEFIQSHPKARKMLERWTRLTRNALWTRLKDIRDTFPDDEAKKTLRSDNSSHMNLLFADI